MASGISALHRRLAATPLGLGGAPLGNLYSAAPDHDSDFATHRKAHARRLGDMRQSGLPALAKFVPRAAPLPGDPH